MSIDVNYYSFSPSRADRKWPQSKEDLPILRQKYALHLEEEKKNQKYQLKVAKIEKRFEEKLQVIREKIYKFFQAKGFYIPWVEWEEKEGTDQYGNPMHWDDEEKMQYLLGYNCLYRQGADLKKKSNPYLVLSEAAPELQKKYEQKIKQRGKAIENINLCSVETREVVLTERQKQLADKTDLSYLKYDKQYNQSQLYYCLKELDLYYGAIINDYFEDPKIEDIYLQALVQQFQLKTEQSLPLKEEWLRLFSELNPENLKQAGSIAAGELDWQTNEGAWGIRDFLRSVRPVVKDLKKTEDAIFLRWYGGVDEVEPPSAEKLLIMRVKKQAKKYKGIIPPVW